MRDLPPVMLELILLNDGDGTSYTVEHSDHNFAKVRWNEDAFAQVYLDGFNRKGEHWNEGRFYLSYPNGRAGRFNSARFTGQAQRIPTFAAYLGSLPIKFLKPVEPICSERE
jgi:hypothetical protein